MAEHFIVQFKSLSDEEIIWCLASDGEIQDSGEVSIDELSQLQSKFNSIEKLAILPTQDCLVTQVVVPSSQRRQQLKAIPYILEEQLAEDIDSLHFAIGKRDELNLIPVCALSKVVLSEYLDRLNSANFQPSVVISLGSLIDSPADAWSIFKLNNQYIVNQSGNCWSGSEEDVVIMLQLSISKIEAENYPSLMVWSEDELPSWIETLALETSHHQVNNSQQALISRINEQRLNLLQGEFEIQDNWSQLWSVWRRVAIIAAVAIILKFILMAVNIGMLKSEQDYLKNEITKTYHQVAPKARIVNAKRQMQQLLGSSGTQENSQSFLVLLNNVAEGMARIPNIEPTNISYDGRKSEIRLDLLVSKLPELDQLKDFLTQRGLEIDVGGASAQGSQYSGRITVKGSR